MLTLKRLLLVLMAYCCICLPSVYADEFRELGWEELMPEGWMPPEPVFPDHTGGGASSALGNEFGDEFGGDFNQIPTPPAPTVPALNGQKVKIPGYVLPTKYNEDSVSEFLLVPYIGACVHVPPPPENQMVYVTLKEPMNAAELWAPVWVSGVLKTELQSSEYAVAGYVMRNAMSDPYVYE